MGVLEVCKVVRARIGGGLPESAVAAHGARARGAQVASTRRVSDAAA
jgi:hypothetical protein